MTHRVELDRKLAKIYDELHPHIFDYEKDVKFVDTVLRRFGVWKVLEVVCETGRLAKRLTKRGYVVHGVDLHEEMLEIARQRVKVVFSR